MGGTAVAASLAGCSGDGGTDSPNDEGESPDGNSPANESDGNDSPADDGGDETVEPPSIDPDTDYADWVPALDGRAGVTYIDRGSLAQIQGEANITFESIATVEDPMLGMALDGALSTFVTSSSQLQVAGLTPILSDGGEFETSVDELLVATEPIVMLGDVFPEEIAGRLTDDTESVAFTEATEFDGYTLYEPAGDMDQTVVFGVGEDAILVAPGRQSIERVVETATGASDPAIAELADFGWLVEQAGAGLLAYGGYDADGLTTDAAETYPFLDGATGFVASQVFDESAMTATMAIVFDTLPANRRGEVEAALGSLAADISVEYDPDRVTATATYPLDVFDDL
jgi:hypothetical protein